MITHTYADARAARTCACEPLCVSNAPAVAAGEIHFVLAGVLFMLGSITTESNRIVLVQKLLQAKAGTARRNAPARLRRCDALLRP